MKTIEIHRLNNNWKYCQKLWKDKSRYHKLFKWSLTPVNTMKYIGQCNYNTQTISISTVFMRGANCNYSKVKKSLMHEIAHALTPGSGHGSEWKRKCSLIGGDTRLAASMNLPGMNWVLYCRKCKWRQEQMTKPNIKNKVCSVCNQQIFIKYIQ